MLRDWLMMSSAFDAIKVITVLSRDPKKKSWRVHVHHVETDRLDSTLATKAISRMAHSQYSVLSISFLPASHGQDAHTLRFIQHFQKFVAPRHWTGCRGRTQHTCSGWFTAWHEAVGCGCCCWVALWKRNHTSYGLTCTSCSQYLRPL